MGLLLLLPFPLFSPLSAFFLHIAAVVFGFFCSAPFLLCQCRFFFLCQYDFLMGDFYLADKVKENLNLVQRHLQERAHEAVEAERLQRVVLLANQIGALGQQLRRVREEATTVTRQNLRRVLEGVCVSRGGRTYPTSPPRRPASAQRCRTAGRCGRASSPSRGERRSPAASSYLRRDVRERTASAT